MAAKVGVWVYGLMGVMLISGTANTLLMKFQVRTEVAQGPSLKPIGFDHPVTQTLFMLLGEILCLVAFYSMRRSQKERVQESNFPKLIMSVPAVFDLIATTLVNAAYIFIPASIAQMCRGSIVLFVCAFSMIFLHRRQHLFHFAGIFLVALGIFLVALAARNSSGAGPGKGGGLEFVGILLCLGAQLFQASQLVVEEKFLSKYTIPPLQAVGLEGVFGSLIVIVVLLIMNPLGAENTIGALYQMRHSAPLTVSIICAIVSIALFNWSGISITAHSSCVARATIDGSRTIFIWIIELILHWNTFKWLQLVGFICLGTGTLVYNRIIEVKSIFHYPDFEEEEAMHTPPPNKMDGDA